MKGAPRVRCWKIWRHRPHWNVGVDFGYEGFVNCWCDGGYRKEDYALAN